MNILKSSGIYSFFTLISRIFGFIRDIIFANFLGTSSLADVFYVAFRFPNTFRRIFSEGALNSSFIPVYAKLLDQQDNNDANIFAGNVSLLLLITSGIIVILAELFMPSFLSILAPGFIENSDKFYSLVMASRIIFPFLVLITMCSIYSAILNAHGRFALSAAMPIILNIILTLIKKKDKVADPNPWNSTTLEWACPSPPIGHGNFEKEPVVYRGPYEYSVPGHKTDFSPQSEKLGEK